MEFEVAGEKLEDAFEAGAAIAFGLMGMAFAIRESKCPFGRSFCEYGNRCWGCGGSRGRRYDDSYTR